MKKNLNNNQSKTSDILPIHVVREDPHHHVISRKIVRFQINAGKTYQINYKYFIPEGFHLAAGNKTNVVCRLEHGQLNVRSVTFIYVKDVAKPATKPSATSNQTNRKPKPSVKAPVPGQPVSVLYIDTDTNKEIKDGKVYGNYNQQVNVLNQIKVPVGYELFNGQKTILKIRRFPQQIRLLVHKKVTHSQNQHPNQPNREPFSMQHRPHFTPRAEAPRQNWHHSTRPSVGLVSNFQRDLDAYNRQLRSRLLHAVLNHGMGSFKQVVMMTLDSLGCKNTNQMQIRSTESEDEVSGVAKQEQRNNQLSTVYVRARRYQPSHPVSISEIRDFCTCVVDNYAYKGIFITTSSFDDADYQEAKRHSIELVNGYRLARLMLQGKIGVRTRQVYRINEVDPHFFND